LTLDEVTDSISSLPPSPLELVAARSRATQAAAAHASRLASRSQRAVPEVVLHTGDIVCARNSDLVMLNSSLLGLPLVPCQVVDIDAMGLPVLLFVRAEMPSAVPPDRRRDLGPACEPFVQCTLEARWFPAKVDVSRGLLA
jgi:hypothetical protein